jgi:hypothetical protein
MADHQMSIHTNFASTWPSGLREENWNLIVYGKSWWNQSDDNTSIHPLGPVS